MRQHRSLYSGIDADQLIISYLLERAGLRLAAVDAAFNAVAHSENWVNQKRDDLTGEGMTPEQRFAMWTARLYGDVPYMASWLTAFCRERDAPRLIGLLEHDNGWVRINAAKALMFIGSSNAIEPIAGLLKASRPEAEYGYSGVLEHAEYNDPTPRWREAYIRALGRLGAVKYDSMLVEILEDLRNVLEIRRAASLALDELGTPTALAALKRAEAEHPFESVH